MTWLDIVLIVLIAAYCAYIVLSKKKYGCCGDCSKCSGYACSAQKKDVGRYETTH